MPQGPQGGHVTAGTTWRAGKVWSSAALSLSGNESGRTGSAIKAWRLTLPVPILHRLHQSESCLRGLRRQGVHGSFSGRSSFRV